MHGNKKRRRCRRFSNNRVFKPAGVPSYQLEEVRIYIDEFEAIRLCDYEGLNQIQASEKMGISRATIQRLLTSARRKITETILDNKALVIVNDIN
jgi:uncharacterized protein